MCVWVSKRKKHFMLLNKEYVSILISGNLVSKAQSMCLARTKILEFLIKIPLAKIVLWFLLFIIKFSKWTKPKQNKHKEWPFSLGVTHEIRLEVPYKEGDLVSVGETIQKWSFEHLVVILAWLVNVSWSPHWEGRIPKHQMMIFFSRY